MCCVCVVVGVLWVCVVCVCVCILKVLSQDLSALGPCNVIIIWNTNG